MDKYVDCQECKETGKCQECNGTGTDSYYGYDCCSCNSSCMYTICNGTGADPRIIGTDIGTVGVSEFVKRQTKESRFSSTYNICQTCGV